MSVGRRQGHQFFSLQSTLGRVVAFSLLMSAYSVLAVVKQYSRYADYGAVHSTVHAILGFVVSMLLVFRTNTAYAKWWEARTLWGTLINASRNLALKGRHFAPVAAEARATGRAARRFRDDAQGPPAARERFASRAGV